MKIIGLQGLALNAKNEIVGVKQVGKDTVAEMIQTMWKGPCYLLSFAGYLKSLVCRIWNLQQSVYDTSDMKEKPIPHLNNWSFRNLLETFGTEVIRKHIDKSFFCNHLASEIKHLQQKHESNLLDMVTNLFKKEKNYLIEPNDTLVNTLRNLPKPVEPLIIVTDVRFPNEYNILKEYKSISLQVKREITTNVDNQHQQHSSNCYYPCMKPDYILFNDGTIEDLRVKVQRFLHNSGFANVTKYFD